MNRPTEDPDLDALTLAALVDAVSPVLRGKTESIEVTRDTIRRFVRFCARARNVFLAADISAEDVEAFVQSRRSQGRAANLGTLHSRRSAVRTLFREGRRLGLVQGDPTLDLSLPARAALDTRPLTDEEVDRCRLVAVPAGEVLRLPTAWALAECTARVSEIGPARVRDTDLKGRRIHLVGGTRMDERWAPMTDWAHTWIGRRLRSLGPHEGPDSPLVPWTVKTVRRPTNAATMAIIEVLRAAGVHGSSDVRPLSVTGWAGARLYNDEDWPIEKVAVALGCRSLDATARMIGLHWRVEDEGSSR